MGLFLNTKGGPSLIDESKTLEKPKHLKFNVINTIDEKEVPFDFFIVRDSDQLEYLMMTLDAYQVDNSFIYDLNINQAYLNDHEIIAYHLYYPSSDGNSTVKFVDYYGSYVNLVTTSKNSENQFQSFDYHHKIFFVSVSKDDVKDIEVFEHKVLYLNK